MATTVEAVPVLLRLGVRLPEGEPRDVEVEAYADSAVADVVGAVAARLGLHGADELAAYLPRSREWLDRRAELTAAGLRQGDELVLAAEGTAPDGIPARAQQAAVELAVVGGLASGRRLPLPPGEHLLGRDPACRITIDDPSLSGRHLCLEVGPDGAVRVADEGSRNGSSLEGVVLPPGERHVVAPGRSVAGTATPVEGPFLLPEAFLSRLVAAPSRARVRLYAHEALRLSGARHPQVGGALTVYVVPTEAGAWSSGVSRAASAKSASRRSAAARRLRRRFDSAGRGRSRSFQTRATRRTRSTLWRS